MSKDEPEPRGEVDVREVGPVLARIRPRRVQAEDGRPRSGLLDEEVGPGARRRNRHVAAPDLCRVPPHRRSGETIDLAQAFDQALQRRPGLGDPQRVALQRDSRMGELPGGKGARPARRARRQDLAPGRRVGRDRDVGRIRRVSSTDAAPSKTTRSIRARSTEKATLVVRPRAAARKRDRPGRGAGARRGGRGSCGGLGVGGRECVASRRSATSAARCTCSRQARKVSSGSRRSMASITRFNSLTVQARRPGRRGRWPATACCG